MKIVLMISIILNLTIFLYVMYYSKKDVFSVDFTTGNKIYVTLGRKSDDFSFSNMIRTDALKNGATLTITEGDYFASVSMVKDDNKDKGVLISEHTILNVK